MSRAPRLARAELAPGYEIPRIVNGAWQLARDHSAAGPPDRRSARAALTRLAEMGFTAFDCADIYTGVEELLGEVAARWRRRGGEPLRIHTKFVPDRSALATLSAVDVDRAIERSLARLAVERLDLVQFHWWDYAVPGYVEAALRLDELRRQGKIRHLGLTNFDRPRLLEVLEAGVEVVSLQAQYSLLDRRPESGMAALCAERGIGLLCYGALAGGFLTERWLGAAEPVRGGEANRSLTKYHLIVDEARGWSHLQELLVELAAVAERHGASVAQVAARWVLDRPGVAAVILGARSPDHATANRSIFALELSDSERRRLDALAARAPGPGGDVYDLERVEGGVHQAILRTDLNLGGSAAGE